MRILTLLISFLFLFAGTTLATISFQISNFEKVSDYYSVDAQISGAATGSAYFIQSMFKRTDVTGYFGYTWGQKGDWIQYLSSPDENYIKTDFPILQTGQTQKFLIKPDTESPKYIGAGEYLLKLKRYTGNSQDGEFSNTLTVTLSDPSPTPEITTTPNTPTPTSTPSPTSTPTPSPTSAPSLTPTRSTAVLSPDSQSGPTLDPTELEVLGSSDSASPSSDLLIPAPPVSREIENHGIGPLTFGGIAVATLALLSLAFWRLRKLTGLDQLK